MQSHTNPADIQYLIGYFMAAVVSRDRPAIKMQWSNSQLLRDVFSGNTINIGTLTHPQGYTMPQQELNVHFKSIYSSGYAFIIQAILEANQAFAQRFCRKQDTESGQDFIQRFQAVFSSQCMYLLKKMWNEEPLLIAWYNGNIVNLGTQAAPRWQTISATEWATDFKAALSSQTAFLIKAMLNGNPRYADWFSGRTVNLGTENHPLMNTLPLENVIANFKAALGSGNVAASTAMWNDNLRLQDKFCCREEDNGNDTPLAQTVFQNFLSALASRNGIVMKTMWAGNQLLQNTVHQLEPEPAKSLLKKVPPPEDVLWQTMSTPCMTLHYLIVC